MPTRSVRFVEVTARSLTDGTVPKNRKPKFDLGLRIIDLNNVPLVTGTAFVKWHLPSSAAAEHRGRTPKAPIKDHKVTWDYATVLGARLVIDKTGMLQNLDIHFEVVQEYSSGARADRISLGVVRLNLAEYVEGGDEDGDDGFQGITRRYLMQESKINSTIKIGIAMKQVDGDRNYMCPPLKTAAVFGGIAGIMNAESADGAGADDSLPPSLASQKARDFGEMQDMYRKSLAAAWSSHMHELPADQCIEDIFAGGDGWGRHADDSLETNVHVAAGSRILAGLDGRTAARQGGAGFAGYLGRKRDSSKDLQSYGRSASAATGSSGSGDVVVNSHSSSSEDNNSNATSSRLKEVNEFEHAQDMSSWRIGPARDKIANLGAPRNAGKVIDK